MAGFSCNKGQNGNDSETGMHNVLVSFELQIWLLSDWLDFNKHVRKSCIFYVNQKQIKEMFVLDFSLCLKSQKQNIQGTHNHAAAKKRESLPANRWRASPREGRFNTQLLL